MRDSKGGVFTPHLFLSVKIDIRGSKRMLKDYYLPIEEELKGSFSRKKNDTKVSAEETPYEPRSRDFTGFTTIRGCGFGKEETRGCDIFTGSVGESIKPTLTDRDELGSTISGSV
jgi:hypothetical protein